MNAIQTDENSFLNSPTVIEKVGPTISKCFSAARACAWGEIVPLSVTKSEECFPMVVNCSLQFFYICVWVKSKCLTSLAVALPLYSTTTVCNILSEIVLSISKS